MIKAKRLSAILACCVFTAAFGAGYFVKQASINHTSGSADGIMPILETDSQKKSYHGEAEGGQTPFASLSIGEASEVIHALALQDIDVAIRGAREWPNRLFRNRLIAKAVTTVSEFNAPLAFSKLSEIPPSTSKTAAEAKVAWDYAEQDLEGLVGQVKNVTHGNLKNRCYLEINRCLTATDPSRAVKEIAFGSNDVHPTILREMRHTALAAWIKIDPVAATNWLTEISDDRAQSEAISTMASSLASNNITSAIKFIETLEGGDNLVPINRLASGIASLWAREDPEGAIKWISARPDDESQNTAQSIYSYWSLQNTNESVMSASRIKDTPRRDRTLASIALTLAKNKRAEAIASAALISDPALKAKTIQSAAEFH